MEVPNRRLRSIAGHMIQSEHISVHRIDSNPIRALDQSSQHLYAPIVIGAMVLDIAAKPDSHPYPGTTTPGKIEHLSGGVARNVVECMMKLGSKPFMISVVGLDMAGKMLLKLWESTELSTEGILKLEDITTPIVSNIFDCKGELIAGVASVCAVENFVSPEWIWKFRHHICAAPILMLDANLHPKSLEAACQIADKAHTPVWFEPVSVTKSTRIASIVPYITCASPNENELVAMANTLPHEGRRFSFVDRMGNGRRHSPQSLFDLLKPAVHLLLENGIKLLAVTLGSDGLFLCFKNAAGFSSTMEKKEALHLDRCLYDLVDKCCPPIFEECLLNSENSRSFAFHFPAPAAAVASLAGAGDCFVGGMISSLCAGLDAMRSAAVGMAVAKAAVEDFRNVPAEIPASRIAFEARKIYSGVKRLQFDA